MQYELLLFDNCLIPRGRFPIRVGWFPNHPFWDSETSLVYGFQVTRNRSRASCFASAFSEGMALCQPPRSSVSWIFAAEHVDIPAQNPEAVWMTGAHPVKWQRPGSWEAQEIGRQLLLLKMDKGWYFLRSPVAASFVAPKFSHRKAVGLEVLVTELGQGPASEVSSWKSQNAASTQHCARNTTINLGTEEEKFQT